MINVVLIADSSYAMPTAVTLASLFASNKGAVGRVYLLSTGMDDADVKKMAALCKANDADFSFVLVDESALDMYDGIGEWPKYTFMKVLIPDYLPESEDTVVYLDSDMLILGRIDHLHTDKALAAVEDIPFTEKHKARCGIAKEHYYINSGFMVMNLPRWRAAFRQRSIADHAKLMASKGPINDQDCISSYFAGDVELLPYEYNVTGVYWAVHNALLPKYGRVWSAARRNPAVVHFTSERKPWIAEVCHPYKPLFLSFLQASPYRDYRDRMVVKRKLRFAGNYLYDRARAALDMLRFLVYGH